MNGSSVNNTVDAPRFRPLRIYAFDPSRGKSAGNEMLARVKYEDLASGPVGERIEVIDYNATNREFYAPVDLNQPDIAMNAGLSPSEGDPRFHQQMVYAVASETMRRFDNALGRRWSFRKVNRRNGKQGPRLRIFPHAMCEANAFYSSEERALFFGYFKALDENVGENLPGQIVFTCLSHDIIAHETTHAMVDGLREHLMEPGGPDVLAFHEAFADITAIFQHFTYREPLRAAIQRTGGLLFSSEFEPEVAGTTVDQARARELGIAEPEPNPLLELAHQFGEAMGERGALRAAIGTPPDPARLGQVFEPHERGSILVAAVFQAFFRIFLKRNTDLMRLIRQGGGVPAPNALPHEAVCRLAESAMSVARHFLRMCIRALDYLPPLDVSYGDFLQAIITADRDLVNYDEYNYRGAIIDAFRSRGVIPQKVISYSEDALCWCTPEQLGLGRLPHCKGLDFGRDPETIANNRRLLTRWVHDNRNRLKFDRHGPAPSVEVFAPAYRVDPDGNLCVQLIAEALQRRPARVASNGAPRSRFARGITFIFNIGPDDGPNLSYVVTKDCDGRPEKEVIRQDNEKFAAYCGQWSAISTYGGAVWPNFRALHNQ